MARPKAGVGVGEGLGVALAIDALQKPASYEYGDPLCGPPAAAWPAVPSSTVAPSKLRPPPLAWTDELIVYFPPLITWALAVRVNVIAVANRAITTGRLLTATLQTVC